MGLIDQYAAKGRKGDTMMAHLTPGEVVIPKEVARMRPDLVAPIAKTVRQLGGDPRKLVAGAGRRNPATGVEEFATDFGMTANQAAELMRRSQTTGAPTSEFDAGGGYDAVVALAKGNTTGYQYGVRTVDDMAQYAPNDAALRVEAGTYPGGGNQTFYASGNSAQGGIIPAAQQASYSAPAQATQTPWDVTPNQTVQQQTEDIVAKDSPLMQQARSLSNQQMNARGLINSSMAIGAGEDAVLGKAIQIGAQDANTYASSAQANAASANALAQFNATQSNAWNTNALDRALSVSQSALNRGSTASEAALNRSATTGNAELDNSFRVQASSDAAFNEQYRMYVDALYKIDINPDLDAQAKVLLKEAQAATLKSYANVRNLNLDLSFL
jgi:hypothetical protein